MRIDRRIGLLVLIAACGGGAPAPEAPQTPLGTLDEEVTWESEGRTIYGTLTKPDGEGRFPAIFFIQGSGPTDRNWEGPLLAGNHGSMRSIAPALASSGIVVLRYDKIATGPHAAEQLPSVVSWDTYRNEQAAAVAFLRQQPSVDPARVFIAGHSEGGAHAMRLVRDLDPPAAGLILLASMTSSLRDTLSRQIREQWASTGADAAEIDRQVRPAEAAMDAIANGAEPDLEAIPEPGTRALIGGFLEPTGLPFTMEYLRIDPVEIVSHIPIPILVVSADRDIQIPVSEGDRLFESARGSGNSNVTRLIVPNADHVFKHEERALDVIMLPENRMEIGTLYAADRPIAPELLDGIRAMVRID